MRIWLERYLLSLCAVTSVLWTWAVSLSAIWQTACGWLGQSLELLTGSRGTRRGGSFSPARLLCSAQAEVTGPLFSWAAAKAFTPGLGTSSIYMMKGSRRWLFLNTAFAHTCAGPKPGWKLCPHEQRRWEGRERGPQKQRELNSPTHTEKSF